MVDNAATVAPPNKRLRIKGPIAPDHADDVDCPVDGILEGIADRAQGKYYLFTVSHPHRSEYLVPETVGREGLYEAIRSTYAAIYPAGTPLHNGPDYGMVAQESHGHSPFWKKRASPF